MSDFDPADEDHRWCIYCLADCWLEPENQQHQNDCPQTTGLYPVTTVDLDMPGGFGCCDCPDPFGVGDHYVVQDETVLCLGCGATALAAR